VNIKVNRINIRKDRFDLITQTDKTDSPPVFLTFYSEVEVIGDYMNENRFYVYLHKLKETNQIFYIGKGTKYRASSSYGRPKDWHEYTKNNEWYVEIYKDNLSNKEAQDLEIKMILEFNPTCNVHKTALDHRKIDETFINNRYEYCETSPTGLIYKVWNEQYGKKRRNAGDIAGTLTHNGYVTVSAGASGSVRVHRIIWLLVNKEDPYGYVVDHIDGNRSNNKINNLRKIDARLNNRNMSIRKDNNTGVIGISEINGGFDVSWTTPNGVRTKFFSISNRGRDLAFALALEVRNNEFVNNKNNNEGYSERHLGNYKRAAILLSYSEDQISEMIASDVSPANTSGVTGVALRVIKGIEYWTSSYASDQYVFSVKKYGRDVAKYLAIEYRNRASGLVPKAIDGFCIEATNFMLEKQLSVSNSSGYRNIRFIELKKKTVIQIQRTINYKNISKRFCCETLGIMVAFRDALQWVKDLDK